MVKMTELNGLFDELLSPCHVRGPAQDNDKSEEPAGQKETTDNTDSREGISAWTKDLRHRILTVGSPARFGAAITPPDGHKTAGVSP